MTYATLRLDLIEEGIIGPAVENVRSFELKNPLPCAQPDNLDGEEFNVILFLDDGSTIKLRV